MNTKFKIIIFCSLLATGALFLSIITYFPINQQGEIQILTLLIFIKPSNNDLISDWPIKIGGSAVSQPKYLNFTNFEFYKNITEYTVVKSSKSEYNHSFEGFSLNFLIYEIMNISTFNNITICPIDYRNQTFLREDIDNDTYKNEIFLANIEEGAPIPPYQDGGTGPVYCITTQNYTISKYGDIYNAHHCTKWVKEIEINL